MLNPVLNKLVRIQSGGNVVREVPFADLDRVLFNWHRGYYTDPKTDIATELKLPAPFDHDAQILSLDASFEKYKAELGLSVQKQTSEEPAPVVSVDSQPAADKFNPLPENLPVATMESLLLDIDQGTALLLMRVGLIVAYYVGQQHADFAAHVFAKAGADPCMVEEVLQQRKRK